MEGRQTDRQTAREGRQFGEGDLTGTGMAPNTRLTRIPSSHSTLLSALNKGPPGNLNFLLGLQWDLHV